MVWNWLEYRMNLQHIGQAWTPMGTIPDHDRAHHSECRGLLWNTFVHVVMYAYYGLKVRLLRKDNLVFFVRPQADDSPGSILLKHFDLQFMDRATTLSSCRC